MTAYVVANAFNTVNRRLRVGDPVSESDDLSPHTFDELKRRKWIASDESKTGAKALRAGNKEAAALAEDEVAATQDELKTEYETGASTGGAPIGQWVVHITDDDLYGRVVFQEGSAIGVAVPGEEAERFYRVDSLDADARSISGTYSDHGGGPPVRRRKR